MRIIFATNNENKVLEVTAILAKFDVPVESAASAGGMPDVPECGTTFAENAVAKARAAAQRFNVPALADDSGLEVAALGGRPGVYSARYAGPGCTYTDNNRKLLAEMATSDPEDRRARFICTAVLILPDGREFIVEGELVGRITTEPRGTGGFGYDPVFIPDGHERTLAEMSPEEKNAISHRRKAFEKMAGVIRALRADRSVDLEDGEIDRIPPDSSGGA